MDVASYDEIRAKLEAAVEEIRVREEAEVEHKERLTADLMCAIEIHNRFVLHGILPDDFAE